MAAAAFEVLHAVMERYAPDKDLSNRVTKYERVIRDGGDPVKVLEILAEELRETDRQRVVRG